MARKVIILCYRKIIDINHTSLWDQYVHEDSFSEFRMQAQLFNPEQKYNSFSDLLIHVPGAEKLHFLVSAAITGYMQQLKGIVPDVLDNLGRRFIAFENFRFEIINSDLRDVQKHKIAINFFSKPLIWHDTVDNYLLVSQEKGQPETDFFTNLFQLQPYLSIHSLKHID